MVADGVHKTIWNSFCTSFTLSGNFVRRIQLHLFNFTSAAQVCNGNPQRSRTIRKNHREPSNLWHHIIWWYHRFYQENSAFGCISAFVFFLVQMDTHFDQSLQYFPSESTQIGLIHFWNESICHIFVFLRTLFYYFLSRVTSKTITCRRSRFHYIQFFSRLEYSLMTTRVYLSS